MKKMAMICLMFLLLSAVSCGSGDREDPTVGNTGEQTQTRDLHGADNAGSEVSSDPIADVIDATSGGPDSQPTPETAAEIHLAPEPSAEEEDYMFQIEIMIGNQTFFATLYDNATARALIDLLPMTLEMNELNGNEKYYDLNNSLPTNASKPSNIQAGDIMLYGNRCIVLFYQSFPTSYSYTLLGHIDDSEGLAAALGNGNVQVTFRKG